jgi:hypothetical protein
MKILMMQSVGTAKGAFNANQVYDVDSDTAKEWIELGYAVRAGGGREATAKAPAKRTATKKRSKKR